jgi:hypothetical protein
MNTKFVIFHQPKTGGTYARKCLPNGYVLDHDNSYHWCLAHSRLPKSTKLVCIIRNPIDYYISLITFWCLDPKHCGPLKKKSLNRLQKEYENNKNNIVGHPNYWMSKGFTERDLVKILNNLFCDEFINNHKKKLSKKHHTYDNYVFLTMSKLDIGYYTFAFLCQYSKKRVSDIKTSKECRDEIIYIYNNFITLNTKHLTQQLKKLCTEYSVKFKDSSKQRVSNRKNISDYNMSNELIKKIRYKDRHMFEIFGE